MKKLRKFFVVSVMVLSVIAMSGLTAPTASAAASAGDLIKMEGLSSVYYLGDDGKRYVFPNESTYFSWFADFSSVVTISATELQSYPLGGNVVMRPGTTLVKITTDPSVYAVEPNGVLRKIQSEAQATALYGTNWNKRIVDLADSFFTNYTIGAPLADGQIPAGSLVKNAGSATVYYYDGTNYRAIASEAAMAANRLWMKYVMTVTNTLTAGGSSLTGMEAPLVRVNQGASTGPVVTGSGLMVSLNSGTAAGTTIVNSQALADLASFNFTAANDGPVTVNTLKLKRIGISADANLDRIYLYEGTRKLTDAGSFSNGFVSFSKGSGLITVPAGQTKTITVKADVNASVTGGNIGVSVYAATDVVSTGATVSGAFPINGNLMSMTTATGLSTVALTDTTATSTVKAGNTNSIVWASSVVVANKAVDFKHITFKQIGSINSDDLVNFSLYVDGTKVDVADLVDNELNFDFTAVRLNTGNHTIELKADIIKGSSRNFSFSMQESANAVFTDTNYNINVAPTGTSILAAPSFTIGTGTLSLSADTTFSTTEVIKTATNATLSRFKLKAFGEDVKVNTMSVNLLTTGTTTVNESISDFAIYVDGTQVGSSKTVTFVATSTNQTYSETFGTTNLFTITAGHEAIVEIKGSMNLESATELQTVKANITGTTAQGVSSYATVSTVAADANNTLNVTSGNLGVAKNNAVQDQNVAKNTQKLHIGSFILSAGSAEGINVSNIRISLHASTTVSTDDMSNLYISENTTPVNPATNNDFNVNFNVAKNSNKIIDVYVDLGDATADQIIRTTATVTYRTDSTQTFGVTNAITGQTLTVKVATLADPTNVSTDPVSKFVIGGTSATAQNLKFVATDGNATINEMTFTVSSETAISQITVDGKSQPVSGSTATLTGLSKEIVAGLQGTNVAVVATYIPVTSSGQGGVATNATSSITLTSVKYTVNGVQSTKTGLTVASNPMTVVAAYPTVELASGTPAGMSSGYLADANSELIRFKVANSGTSNPINLKTITITPVWSGTLTATTSQAIKVYESTDLTTVIGTANFGATSGTKVKITFTADSIINTEKTYVVKADTSGLTTNGNSIRLSLTSADVAAGLDDAGTGDWSWNDSTVANYANGYLIKNLPVDGYTMVK